MLDQWLAQAARNYRQLLELLDAVHGYRFRQPSGSHDSLVEFDRLRTIKDSLIQKIIATCVETATAARLLMTTREDAGDAERFGEPVDAVSVQSAAVGAGGRPGRRARACGATFWRRSSRGRCCTCRTRAAASRGRWSSRAAGSGCCNDLLGWLPKLGLIRETCELLELAQQLESDNPVGQGAVTEFDTLFENGYQAIVRAIVEVGRTVERRAARSRKRRCRSPAGRRAAAAHRAAARSLAGPQPHAAAERRRKAFVAKTTGRGS